VVWWGGLLGVYDVYLFDGATVTNLSQTGTQNQFPKIDGNLVVWQGKNGNDLDIFVYDGTSVFPLTDNDYDDTLPQISGNHIVWQSLAGGTDIEIMSAWRALFGDANFDGLVDGADYTLWADHYLQEDVGFSLGDFNQDGLVDGADYTLWADNYLESDGAFAPSLAAAAVPEPASAALALLGAGIGAGIWGARRARASGKSA
ncbi:MAG: PEP-CTERM sorting domain-containing protein, partial [Planctomycetaceae bacterium]|nr:PEP-CTERM sorting domain-containing protein [Planctomycetaceae bacterium]